MGGIGPNINSDEWKDKNSKVKKMQEFSEIVKVNNKEKLMFLPGESKKIENNN